MYIIPDKIVFIYIIHFLYPLFDLSKKYKINIDNISLLIYKNLQKQMSVSQIILDPITILQMTNYF
jgi:hypothetical protein